MKTFVLAGASLAALMTCAPVWAQSSTEPGDAASGLTEIIVTAQRRSENLQDVPMAVTAVSADALATARMDNIANIQAVTPSVGFKSSNISSSTANVVNRGLGTSGNSRSFEGSAGVFIDGVYRTRAGAALQNFLDIDSLQVLLGPQGTLFGKNTTAGALLLSSTMPSTDRVEGSVEILAGNFDVHSGKASINLPLGQTLAFRLSALAAERDGFIRDPNRSRTYNNDNSKAIKGQLLFEPDGNVSVRLVGDYSRGTGDCCYGTVNFRPRPTQPLVDGLTQLAGLRVPSANPRRREQTLNTNGRQVVEDYGATLLTDVSLGSGTLKSITAIRRFRVDQNDMDADFSSADILHFAEDFSSRFLSQELTYNAAVPAVDADIVLGMFFSDERLRMGRQLEWGAQAQPYWDAVLGRSGLPAGTAFAGPGLWTSEAMRGTARSYPAFAHADFLIASNFNAIAGLRYSIERKTGGFRNLFYSPAPTDVFQLLGVQPGPAYDSQTTNRALSGTFSLQFRPADDVMLYAIYNRGFKAGGVNIDANGAGTLLNNPARFSALPGPIRGLISFINGGRGVSAPLNPNYRPEKVNAVELGAKLQYLDRRARTNIAVFHYDLSDLQIAQFVGLSFTVLNARSARLSGAEIENTIELARGLTLSIDGTWIPQASYGVDPGIDPALSGQSFRFAPKLAANAALSIDTPLTASLNATGRVQYQYSSRQFINTANTSTQGAVSLVNANIGIRAEAIGLTVEAWVQNFFDTSYGASSPCLDDDYGPCLPSKPLQAGLPAVRQAVLNLARSAPMHCPRRGCSLGNGPIMLLPKMC